MPDIIDYNTEKEIYLRLGLSAEEVEQIEIDEYVKSMSIVQIANYYKQLQKYGWVACLECGIDTENKFPFCATCRDAEEDWYKVYTAVFLFSVAAFPLVSFLRLL